MTNFTTTLLQELTQSSFNLDNFFRQELETAINQLLADELTSFLGYSAHSLEGYNTGNSRNGYYERQLDTKYGRLHLKIPRDRQGQFKQALIPEYGRRTGDLEELVIQLYSKGMTTSEMANIIEKLYGHHYSPATVANITKLTEQSVSAFHERQLNTCYTAILMDATYLHLRRDTVAKEAVHIALGITVDGYKEVLGYQVAPSENLATWTEVLQQLKRQGLEQVSLFISDGFVGLQDLVLKEFPTAQYQSCLVHIDRNIGYKVRQSDRSDILKAFKTCYQAEDLDAAQQAFENFKQRWQKAYPRLISSLEEKADHLFTFMTFPKAIWKTLYTTNAIENVNLLIKRQLKKKPVFQNEAALDRFLVTQFDQYNLSAGQRRTTGFSHCQDTLESLFE